MLLNVFQHYSGLSALKHFLTNYWNCIKFLPFIELFLPFKRSLTNEIVLSYSMEQMEQKLLYSINADAGFDLS